MIYGICQQVYVLLGLFQDSLTTCRGRLAYPQPNTHLMNPFPVQLLILGFNFCNWKFSLMNRSNVSFADFSIFRLQLFNRFWKLTLLGIILGLEFMCFSNRCWPSVVLSLNFLVLCSCSPNLSKDGRLDAPTQSSLHFLHCALQTKFLLLQGVLFWHNMHVQDPNEFCRMRDFTLLPGSVTMRAFICVFLIMVFTFLVKASSMQGMDIMNSQGFLDLGGGDFHVLWQP